MIKRITIVIIAILALAGCDRAPEIEDSVLGMWLAKDFDGHDLFLELSDQKGTLSGSLTIKNPERTLYHDLKDCSAENSQVRFVVPIGGYGDDDNLLFKLQVREDRLRGTIHDARNPSDMYDGSDSVIEFARVDSDSSPSRRLQGDTVDRSDPIAVARSFFTAVREHDGEIAMNLWAGPPEERTQVREAVNSGVAQEDWEVPQEFGVEISRISMDDGEKVTEATFNNFDSNTDMVFRDNKWWMCR